MLFTVHKLYHGFASVRDHVVNECIKKDEDLVIFHKGERMTIPVDRLKNRLKFQINKNKYKNRVRAGQYYELIDFFYQPDSKAKKDV